MFESITNVKQFITSFSDVKKSSQKINGNVYVHLSRDSKDPKIFTVKLETNAFDAASAGSALKRKYEQIQAALKVEGYRICATLPFGVIKDLDVDRHYAVYAKQMTFCEKGF